MAEVDILKNIIKNALLKSEIRDWTYDGEEEEFKDMIAIFQELLDIAEDLKDK